MKKSLNFSLYLSLYIHSDLSLCMPIQICHSVYGSLDQYFCMNFSSQLTFKNIMVITNPFIIQNSYFKKIYAHIIVCVCVFVKRFPAKKKKKTGLHFSIHFQFSKKTTGKFFQQLIYISSVLTYFILSFFTIKEKTSIYSYIENILEKFKYLFIDSSPFLACVCVYLCMGTLLHICICVEYCGYFYFLLFFSTLPQGHPQKT